MQNPNETTLERFMRERAEVDVYFSEVTKHKTVQTINYSVFLDTFHLFVLAQQQLDQIFNQINRQRLLFGIALPNTDMLRRPSSGEYVKFAELYLQQIKRGYEARVLAEIPQSISEHELKSTIRAVLFEGRALGDIIAANVIVSFKPETHLFGALFDKNEHLQKLEWEERRPNNKGNLNLLKDLKHNVAENDTVFIYGKPKCFKSYNEFVSSLRDFNDKSELPGKYKFWIEDGKFTHHSEKGVDISLAIKSISTAYEDPFAHQLFCVVDTDFIPILRKLEEMGVDFFVVHAGQNDRRLPQEFRPYLEQRRLMILDSSELLRKTITEIVDLFMHDGGHSYSGENSDGWKRIAAIVHNELHEQWIEENERRREQETDDLA